MVAVAGALAGALATGSPAATPGIPAIYISYSSNCTFTMTVDPGTPITATAAPGPTLPPGVYQIEVWMPNPGEGYSCGKPRFTLTGPGVASVTQFNGQELEDDHVLPAFQPSSTYVARDENVPDSTQRFFTTAASGSNSGLLPTTGSQAGSAKGSAQADIVGSANVPFRGKLLAAVSQAGKASLKAGTRNVGSLEAGRYDIRVADSDPHAGFFVQRRTGKPIAVTGVAFVGSRTHRVTLTTGKWTFFSESGHATQFTVVGQ